jgi:hypothetical protein
MSQVSFIRKRSTLTASNGKRSRRRSGLKSTISAGDCTTSQMLGRPVLQRTRLHQLATCMGGGCANHLIINVTKWKQIGAWHCDVDLLRTAPNFIHCETRSLRATLPSTIPIPQDPLHPFTPEPPSRPLLLAHRNPYHALPSRLQPNALSAKSETAVYTARVVKTICMPPQS